MILLLFKFFLMHNAYKTTKCQEILFGRQPATPLPPSVSALMP